MISEEIFNKLTIEELEDIHRQVQMVLSQKKSQIDNMVQHSEISERCKKVLEENNISTWDQLVLRFSEEELRQWRNCGSKTILEILNELDNRGMKLK